MRVGRAAGRKASTTRRDVDFGGNTPFAPLTLMYANTSLAPTSGVTLEFSQILISLHVFLYIFIKSLYLQICCMFLYIFLNFFHIKLIINKRGRRRHPPPISLSSLYEQNPKIYTNTHTQNICKYT